MCSEKPKDALLHLIIRVPRVAPNWRRAGVTPFPGPSFLLGYLPATAGPGSLSFFSPGPSSTLKMVQITHAMRVLAFVSYRRCRAGFALVNNAIP